MSVNVNKNLRAKNNYFVLLSHGDFRNRESGYVNGIPQLFEIVIDNRNIRGIITVSVGALTTTKEKKMYWTEKFMMSWVTDQTYSIVGDCYSIYVVYYLLEDCGIKNMKIVSEDKRIVDFKKDIASKVESPLE